MTNSKSAFDNKSKNIAVNIYCAIFKVGNGTHCTLMLLHHILEAALVRIIKLRNLFM
jgi:hypothetical protein